MRVSCGESDLMVDSKGSAADPASSLSPTLTLRTKQFTKQVGLFSAHVENAQIYATISLTRRSIFWQEMGHGKQQYCALTPRRQMKDKSCHMSSR
jgi:hypothetical protein